MVYLDGTFLKSEYKGCLLAATAKNGGQGLFPLAIGVVDIENEANWFWFLELFKKAFECERRYTFLSDKHHGLLVNIPLVFPGSYHSFCFWHMENNLRTTLSKKCGVTKVLVALYKKCAYSATHEEFEEHMGEMLNIGGDAVSNFLSRAPYENWSNVYFCSARYGEMCSSLAESFNNWIDKERYLPITSMFDEIRIKMMKMAFERRVECKNWKSVLRPKIEAKLAERTEMARCLTVIRSEEYVFQVITEKHEYRVDLLRRDCTYNCWGIDGFPCHHAITCIYCKGDSVYSYIEVAFHTSSFSSTYSHGVTAISHSDYCSLFVSNEVKILPPDVKRVLGRL